MNERKISSLLTEMVRVCEELRAEILAHSVAPGKDVREHSSPRSRAPAKKRGPTDWIKDLIAAGFFASPRTDLEVKSELKRRARGCGRVAVAVALSRLVHKEILTREGSGTGKSPYRYSGPA